MKTNNLFLNKPLTSLFLTIAFGFPLSISAESNTDYSISCNMSVFENNNTKFTKLLEKNKNFSIQICKELLYIDKQDANNNINEIIQQVSNENANEISQYFFNTKFSTNIKNLFKNFENKATESPLTQKKLGVLSIDTFDRKYPHLNISGISEPTVGFPFDTKCENVNGITYNSCYDTLSDINKAFNAYQTHYNKYVTGKNIALLNNMSNDWNRFLDKARSQTFLDILATTTLNSYHYKKDHLVSPAPTQYFFLHPTFVYEYVDNAQDGQKDKASAAIEWIGVNWWDAKVPFGISIVSTYSDRKDISSVGIGAMLYIDNKYSFGWTHRKEGDGFFINIDILNLYKDKKDQFEEYKSNFL